MKRPRMIFPRWILPFLCLSILLLASCQQQRGLVPADQPQDTPEATETSEVNDVATVAVTAAADEPGVTEPATREITREVGPIVDETPESANVIEWPEVPGALIGVSLNSQVGVLLDEFPAEMRDRVATSLIEESEEVWRRRAERQVRLTRLRLNFRNFVYDGFRGQLPLPPADLWQIQLDPAGPSRQEIQGHELVLVDYSMSTTILTDEASPAAAEPALAQTGGVWHEPFVFPADPDLLLQRTGNACINEGGFPPNSFDSENIRHLYDFECTADSGGATGCHRTLLPSLSCQEALAARVGEVRTNIRFERLPWDAQLAEQVRTGPLSVLDAPDLMVVGADLESNRIVYRYIEPEDCAIEEHAVGGSGWRRLILFDATIHNIGGRELHIGPVLAEDPVNNVFDYNLCHDHFHYTNYGEFFVDSRELLTGSKQAFCVQSTNRLSNNELSPLGHEYSCRFQGVQAGWVDEYIAGLDTQWIDITDLEIPAEGRSVRLGFSSNGDRFLCEGEPVLNGQGQKVWEASGFETEEGAPINRPLCNFIPDWDANNEGTTEVLVPAVGSFVTEPCRNEESGPLRNCGFGELNMADLDPLCRPGDAIKLALDNETEEAPQVLRICERSARLGTGVACTFENALLNVSISAGESAVSFSCPPLRDVVDESPGGGYAAYIAPLWPGDAAVSLVSPADN